MPEELQIEDTPTAPLWGTDDATLARWSELTPGTEVTIVKWSAQRGGEERARYPARIAPSPIPSPWVVFETHWTMGKHDQGLLILENGDTLHEIFSPVHPYDAFAVYRPTGELKGWYGNVTHPAFFAPDTEDLVLVWHDLFIDIIATADGEVAVLDEDELEEANLSATDPELHARILAARDELLERFHTRQPPFTSPKYLEFETNW